MFKIVEVQPNVFKLYRKVWFFWKCFDTYYGGSSAADLTFKTRKEAEEHMMQYIKENDLHEKHVKTVQHYNKSGLAIRY